MTISHLNPDAILDDSITLDKLTDEVKDFISDKVSISPQTLTDAQKEQARENIGAQKDVNIRRVGWVGRKYLCVSAGVNIGYSVRIDIDYESGGIGTLILTNKGSALSAYYYGDTLSSKIAAVSLYTDGNGKKWFVLEATSIPGGHTCLITPFRGAVTTKTEIDISTWAKAYDASVVELGAGGGKYGVISQTQKWNGTGSNPRTYTMSGQVYGTIPQANIDLFEAAGATFNSVSGYFELNGLTDISYEEMRVIYDCTIGLIPNISRDKALAGDIIPTIRTTLPMRGVTSFASSIAYFAYGNIYLEQIVFAPVLYNSAQNNGSGAFQNCYCLKSIFGRLRLYSTTNDANIFRNCYSLENVSIEALRGSLTLAQSSALSLASVVCMVKNAENTSAITITLHADAYARCQADTTEYSYWGNTYTGIIAYANARNITIASA